MTETQDHTTPILPFRSTITLFIDHAEEIDTDLLDQVADDLRVNAARHLKKHPGRSPRYTGTRSNGPGV